MNPINDAKRYQSGVSVSFTRELAVDRRCSRDDCAGWCGFVSYVQGDYRRSLPVIDRCAALKAFVDLGEHQHCPLTQGDTCTGEHL